MLAPNYPLRLGNCPLRLKGENCKGQNPVICSPQLPIIRYPWAESRTITQAKLAGNGRLGREAATHRQEGEEAAPPLG